MYRQTMFYYIKVGCTGVFITRTGYHDDFYYVDVHKCAILIYYKAYPLSFPSKYLRPWSPNFEKSIQVVMVFGPDDDPEPFR